MYYRLSGWQRHARQRTTFLGRCFPEGSPCKAYTPASIQLRILPLHLIFLVSISAIIDSGT